MKAVSLRSSSDQFSLRRIILEKDKAYSGTNDNANLYFCGFTSARSGDMIYGNLISTDITLLSLRLIFQYGSTSSEFTYTASEDIPFFYGDCTLTEDNAYMLATFSTA